MDITGHPIVYEGKRCMMAMSNNVTEKKYSLKKPECRKEDQAETSNRCHAYRPGKRAAWIGRRTSRQYQPDTCFSQVIYWMFIAGKGTLKKLLKKGRGIAWFCHGRDTETFKTPASFFGRYYITGVVVQTCKGHGHRQQHRHSPGLGRLQWSWPGT